MGNAFSSEMQDFELLTLNEGLPWQPLCARFLAKCEEHPFTGNQPVVLIKVLEWIGRELLADQNKVYVMLHALEHILSSRALFSLVPRCSLIPLANALSCGDRRVIVHALGVVRATIKFQAAANGRVAADLKAEAANRKHFADVHGFHCLAMLVKFYAVDFDLDIVQRILDIFELVLPLWPSPAFGATLDSGDVGAALTSVESEALDILTSICQYLFELASTVDGTQLQRTARRLICVLLANTTEVPRSAIQDAARLHGFLLYSIHAAVAHAVPVAPSPDADSDLVSPRDVVALLCENNRNSSDAFLRALPSGFERIRQLSRRSAHVSTEATAEVEAAALPPLTRSASEGSPDTRVKAAAAALRRKFSASAAFVLSPSCASRAPAETEAPIRSPIRSVTLPWSRLLDAICVDHDDIDLQWDASGRLQLLDGLRQELQSLWRRRDTLGRFVAWDWEGFEIRYPALEGQLRVGGLYARRLLRALLELDGAFVHVDEPSKVISDVLESFAVGVSSEDRYPVRPNIQPAHTAQQHSYVV